MPYPLNNSFFSSIKIKDQLFNDRKIFFFVIPLLLMGITIPLMLPDQLIMDESFHFKQTLLLKEYKWEIYPGLTVIPGYHFLLSVFSNLFGLNSLVGIRYLSVAIIIIGSVIIFFLDAEDQNKRRRMTYLLVISFPIIFPYLFLLYTDILALIVVMWCFFLMNKKKYILATILGVISVTIRQTNVVWMAFIFLNTVFNELDYTISFNKLLQLSRKIWLFLCVFLFTIVFIIYNGGIAMQDNSMHPAFSFEIGNIIFFLFLFCVLLLPNSVYYFKDIVSSIKKPLILVTSIVLFFIFFYFCHFEHPYNVGDGNDYSLRNNILYLAESNIVFKIFFCFSSVYSFLVILNTKLKKTAMYLIYPFMLFLFSSSWLVENRYYIVGFVFYFIFSEKNIATNLQIIWNVVISLILWIGISNMDFFL